MYIKKNIIVVLGYKLGKNNKMSYILKNRLDKCLNEYNTNTTIILTGGKLSKDLKSEAVIMRDWLINKNIPKDDIIIEPKSKDTIENIKNVKKILERNKVNKIKLITSAWHVRRTKLIIKTIMPDIKVNFIKSNGGDSKTRKLLEERNYRNALKHFNN